MSVEDSYGQCVRNKSKSLKTNKKIKIFSNWPVENAVQCVFYLMIYWTPTNKYDNP